MSLYSSGSVPFNDCGYDVSKEIKKEGLTTQDFEEICTRLGRCPNRTELGMFGVMWSEHCCYRNSKPLLNNFPTTGPGILVGPGENAGVVDVGEGQRLAFKIESHNHPSAIEPFQGAATGVGGILRDIFTMGARPIAILNALRFGPLNEIKNVALMQGVVSGIAHYGNCVGVPTIGGEVGFDQSYSGNPLVNAMALGLMETEEIVCSGAVGIGFSVLYVGSTTGRDGMGGASFASAELSNSSLDDRPAVQVGDPFLEKSLIEACLEAFKSGDVMAAQDMGAAGLTCSCSEMASKGGLGIELDLDLVPSREEGMTAYEYLLSESQERMLFIVKPNSEERVIKLFNRWGLQAAIVGKVLEDNVVRVLHKGKVEAEIPASALADDTPVNKHALLSEPPSEIKEHWQWNESKLSKASKEGIQINNNNKQNFINWNQVLINLLEEPNIASKQWIYNQYDYQVQLNTVLPPGTAGAAVIRLRPQDNVNNDSTNRGIAAVVDCPNRWVYLDPERGSIAAVAEASRNISCVGAKPLAVTDNLNFASPETSTGYWQLAQSCKGISTACQKLETPVTGGNVSLYNDTRLADGTLQPIQPTPVIGMVGLIEDLNKSKGQSWIKSGDEIWMLGFPLETLKIEKEIISLSASSYLEYVHNLITGRPPKIDLNLEYKTQKFLRQAISDELISSAQDVSDGGIAVALAECSITSGLGCHIVLPSSVSRMDRLLFAEGGSRVLVSISPTKKDIWSEVINNWIESDADLFLPQHLGYVSSSKSFEIVQEDCTVLKLSVDDLRNRYASSISNIMKG